MSVSEAQSKVSSKEFLGWLAYFEKEFSVREKTDFYLAQIAQTIHNVNVSKKTDAKPLKHFLLDFKNRDAEPKKKVSRKKQIEWSKAAWLGAVGLGNKVAT